MNALKFRGKEDFIIFLPSISQIWNKISPPFRHQILVKYLPVTASGIILGFHELKFFKFTFQPLGRKGHSFKMIPSCQAYNYSCQIKLIIKYCPLFPKI